MSKKTDEYYGYYDMYCVEKMKIIKELSRKEIIDIGLNLNEIRIKRFLSTLILTEEEIELFKNKYNGKRDVINTISYYQEGNKNIYIKK